MKWNIHIQNVLKTRPTVYKISYKYLYLPVMKTVYESLVESGLEAHPLDHYWPYNIEGKDWCLLVNMLFGIMKIGKGTFSTMNPGAVIFLMTGKTECREGPGNTTRSVTL